MQIIIIIKNVLDNQKQGAKGDSDRWWESLGGDFVWRHWFWYECGLFPPKDWIFSAFQWFSVLSSDSFTLSIWSSLWTWCRGHRLSPKSNLCKSFCFLKLCHFSWLFFLIWYGTLQLLSFCIRQMYFVKKTTKQFIQL